jgi:hypothetical protein
MTNKPFVHTGKPCEKVIPKIIQRHVDENNLLNACYSATPQCMKITDHTTFNFNNGMSMVAVFLDSEKAFDTT